MYKVKAVLQSEHSECGLAVASCILDYFERDASLSRLRETYGSPRGGISIGDIKAVLHDGNIEYKGVRIADYSILPQLDAPAILHWKRNHFIVYAGTLLGKHLIMDPSQGKELIDDRELCEGFDGNALILDRVLSDARGCSRRQELTDPLHIRSLVRRNAFSLISIAACMIVLRLIMLFVPFVSQAIVDGAFEGVAAINIAVLLAVMSLLHYGCSALSGYLLTKLQITWGRELTERLVGSILSRKYPFFINQSSGSLTYKINLMSSIQQLLSTNLVQNLISVIFSIMYFCMLYTFSPTICMLVLVVCVFSATLSLIYARWNLSMNRRVLKVGSDAQSVITEMLEGIETVKAMGAERDFFISWRDVYYRSTELTFRQGKASSFFSSISSSMLSLLPIIVLLAGIGLLNSGLITVGALVACLSMSGYFSEPFSTLVQSAIQWTTLRGALEQIEDLLGDDNFHGGSKEKIAGRMTGARIDNLSFRYSAFSLQAISDATFSINAGEKVAIVGRSGSGKSTLLKLISGLLEPTDGSIVFQLDGEACYNASDIGGRVSYLPQKPAVFGKRIEDNLMLNSSPLPFERIGEILDITGITEMLQLENAGIDQLISEGGKNLSGGQIQRLALARCLLLDPEVIIMDEPTSSLDAIAEKRIMDYLIQSKLTVVLSAHRLETISKMDRIVVIDEGRIVESGKHEELLARGGQYARLYESAALGKLTS